MLEEEHKEFKILKEKLGNSILFSILEGVFCVLEYILFSTIFFSISHEISRPFYNIFTSQLDEKQIEGSPFRILLENRNLSLHLTTILRTSLSFSLTFAYFLYRYSSTLKRTLPLS